MIEDRYFLMLTNRIIYEEIFMSIKLVAVDIDGTLITDDRKITDQVFEAVQDAKKQGVHVVIATGRPIAGVTQLLDDLNLNHQGDYKSKIKCSHACYY